MVPRREVRAFREEKSDVEQPTITNAADAAMEQYARGVDAAFASLYDALAARLYRYIHRQVRDAHRADDLLQETFLRMHRARGSFAPGSPVLPWAFAIARRLVVDDVRRDRRTPLVGEAEPLRSIPALSGDGPEQLAEARQFAHRVAQVLERLPQSQRTAFGLLKEDGLTLVEAAAVLGVTVTAVKMRAHRAYETLRGALGQGVGDFPARAQ